MLGRCHEHRRHPDFCKRGCRGARLRLLAAVAHGHERRRRARRFARAFHDRDRRRRLHVRGPSRVGAAFAGKAGHERRACAGDDAGLADAAKPPRSARLVRARPRLSHPAGCTGCGRRLQARHSACFAGGAAGYAVGLRRSADAGGARRRHAGSGSGFPRGTCRRSERCESTLLSGPGLCGAPRLRACAGAVAEPCLRTRRRMRRGAASCSIASRSCRA